MLGERGLSIGSTDALVKVRNRPVNNVSERTSAAEAAVDFVAFTARLESRALSKQNRNEFFHQTLKPVWEEWGYRSAGSAAPPEIKRDRSEQPNIKRVVMRVVILSEAKNLCVLALTRKCMGPSLCSG